MLYHMPKFAILLYTYKYELCKKCLNSHTIHYAMIQNQNIIACQYTKVHKALICNVRWLYVNEVMVWNKCQSYELIVSTHKPCGVLYYTHWQPKSLRENPRGLMHFQTQWQLVREAMFLLVFSMWSSIGFSFVLLYSSKVIPRWRS